MSLRGQGHGDIATRGAGHVVLELHLGGEGRQGRELLVTMTTRSVRGKHTASS